MGFGNKKADCVKPAKKLKNCNCIKKMNASLKDKDCELDVVHQLMRGISTTSIKLSSLGTKRSKVAYLVPTYCPFCGKKHP